MNSQEGSAGLRCSIVRRCGPHTRGSVSSAQTIFKGQGWDFSDDGKEGRHDGVWWKRKGLLCNVWVGWKGGLIPPCRESSDVSATERANERQVNRSAQVWNRFIEEGVEGGVERCAQSRHWKRRFCSQFWNSMNGLKLEIACSQIAFQR